MPYILLIAAGALLVISLVVIELPGRNPWWIVMVSILRFLVIFAVAYWAFSLPPMGPAQRSALHTDDPVTVLGTRILEPYESGVLTMTREVEGLKRTIIWPLALLVWIAAFPGISRLTLVVIGQSGVLLRALKSRGEAHREDSNSGTGTQL